MWWLFTKKIQRHPEIAQGERVLRACYGLGPKMVQFANRSLTPSAATWDVPQATDGYAAALDRNGIVALTDRRLCFFPKVFAFGSPRTMKADWPLEQVESISYSDNQLRIEFVDGSVAELHVPAAQAPMKLIDAFTSLQTTG